MFSFLIGTVLFFIGGLLATLLKERFKGIVFLIAASLAQIFILPNIVKVLFYGDQIQTSIIFSEPIGISFIRIDSLAALFVLIISLGSLLASIYSIGYMKMYSGKTARLSSYYFFLGLMISSMLLVVTVQNAILFLVVWEIMSISSFFLVGFENEKIEVRKASIYYLIAMQIGAAFLITAFSWASAISGSLDFLSFKNILTSSSGISILLFFLFFIGFGTKAGFVPMHTWLPKAHPAAPTGVSALMSGVMIKTGIYGILRIILLSGTPDYRLSYGVFFISLITGIYGVANAIAQHDLKKLLAYHSVENIGIIGMGIGIGMIGLTYHLPSIAVLGFLGGILHIFNHFTFKSLLFFGAGTVYFKTHTRNIDKLGGLINYLPITAYLFLLGSIAISGLPLFSGFISEFAIYLGMVKSFALDNLALNVAILIGFAGLALIGVMALLCFTKVFGICFLGMPRSAYGGNISKEGSAFLFPMIILSTIIVIIGLLPQLVLPFMRQIINQFLNMNINREFINITQIYNWLANSFLLLAGLIVFFSLLRFFLLRNKKVASFKTWDCGYQAESSRIQYTSSSFAQPFLNLVSGIVPQGIIVEKVLDYFPKTITLESHSNDSSEQFLIQPSIKWLNKVLSKFAWIQSGKMQQYITYGLIFLIILLIWILGIEK